MLVQPVHLLHESFLEERDDDEATAERERTGLQEERQQLTQQRAERARRRGGGDERHADHERRRRCGFAATKERAVVEKADDPAPDEDQRDFGLDRNRDDECRRCERPLEPVFHPELREPIARVEDQCDDGGTHAVEDRGHPRQPSEVDVERAERRDDDEVRQDERPAAGPGPPEAAADVRDPDADLDGEGAR